MPPSKQLVLFDHDGGVDDFLSLLLLLVMPHVELVGVSITPADYYPDQALETTAKLLHLLGQPQVPLSVGQYHGVNAFPSAWRAQPRMLNALPTLLALPPSAPFPTDPRPSPEVLRAQLAAASRPVTVVLTGPCSTLVQALAPAPHLASRIGQVVWMGGAVDVPGNVRTYNQDGSAEWNVFWDPLAARQLLAYQLPLTPGAARCHQPGAGGPGLFAAAGGAGCPPAQPAGGPVLGYHGGHHSHLRVHVFYVGCAGH